MVVIGRFYWKRSIKLHRLLSSLSLHNRVAYFFFSPLFDALHCCKKMSNPLSRFVNAASLNKLKWVIMMNLRNLTQFHQKVSTLLGVGCQVRCHGFTFFPGSVKLFDSVVLRCNKNLNFGVNLRCLFGSLSFGCKVIQLEHLYTE